MASKNIFSDFSRFSKTFLNSSPSSAINDDIYTFKDDDLHFVDIHRKNAVEITSQSMEIDAPSTPIFECESALLVNSDVTSVIDELIENSDKENEVSKYPFGLKKKILSFLKEFLR